MPDPTMAGGLGRCGGGGGCGPPAVAGAFAVPVAGGHCDGWAKGTVAAAIAGCAALWYPPPITGALLVGADTCAAAVAG